jgi:hypothetical protein
MSHSSNVNKSFNELHEEIITDLDDSHMKCMPKSNRKSSHLADARTNARQCYVSGTFPMRERGGYYV